MAQFGIHMCWYCCYVWSFHRFYLEFLDLARSKLVLAFTSFDKKFTFSDMPDLLAPELQPPLPYHYFSESDSSNPEKGMIKYLNGCCFEIDFDNLLPGDRQACSVPRSRRRRSLKAQRSCSSTLVGWKTGTESPWTLGTPAIVVKIYLYMTLNKQRKPPETLSHLRPSFQESEVLSCGPSPVAHSWRAWFAKQQPAIKAWLVGSFR